jgi:hypothetical protein
LRRSRPDFSDVFKILAVLCATAVVSFTHAPHGTLAGAKASRGVDLLARSVKIDLNVETVFAAAVAEVLGGRDFKLVYARAQSVIAGMTDDIAALAD